MPRDFFKELPNCLDRSKSWEENRQSLKRYYDRVRNWTDRSALQKQAMLQEALGYFDSKETYNRYLAALNSEAKARAQADEARKWREDELEHELEVERRRRADAEERARRAEAAKPRAAERTEARREREPEPVETPYNPPRVAQPDDVLFWRSRSKQLRDNTQRVGQPVETLSVETAADLTGTWRTQDGYLCRIRQNGHDVGIQIFNASNNSCVFVSSGSFDGQFVRVNFMATPFPTAMPMHGVATLQLIDGWTLRGQGINHATGQTFPILFRRVS